MNKDEKKILKNSYRILFIGTFLCIIDIMLMIGTKSIPLPLNIGAILNAFEDIVLIFGFCTIGFSMVYLIVSIGKLS